MVKITELNITAVKLTTPLLREVDANIGYNIWSVCSVVIDWRITFNITDVVAACVKGQFNLTNV